MGSENFFKWPPVIMTVCLNEESTVSAPSQLSPLTDGADEAQGKVNGL